ncbi:hypothetical protein EV363DRAFT_1435093 [Boletus edulis]|nr:hypothetical protein EV363DRAFT_1435093 [Boletus edulis]
MRKTLGNLQDTLELFEWIPNTIIKVVSVPSVPCAGQGLPASTIVLNEITGCVKAIMDATYLTALRNATGSVFVTRLLIFKVPKTLAHVDLHLRAFPSIEFCTIVNRTGTDSSRLYELASSLRQSQPSIVFNTIKLGDRHSVKDAVSKADVICTAMSSEGPLFQSDFTPRMHEVDSELIHRACKVVVDSRGACAIEAGELIAACKAMDPNANLIELGELEKEGDGGKFVPVEMPKGLREPDGVTILKSVGVGLQDVAIAHLVQSRAESTGCGTRIKYYDPIVLG